MDKADGFQSLFNSTFVPGGERSEKRIDHDNSSANRNRNTIGYHFSLSLSLVEKRVKLTLPNGQR
jgi:hypothetical protein